MLKVLRNKKTAKKIWIGLALIIIPAFTLWGFGGAFKSSEESQPLGKIFGRQVTPLELKDAVSAVTTTAIMRFGDKFPEIQKFLNLEAQAWQRLILLEEAKKRKITVSDKEVIELIESYPFFQYKGNFDNKTYTQVLQYVFRLQPRAFEEQTRQNLMLNKLFKQVSEGIRVNDADVALAFDQANQEISIYYIPSLIADFAKKIKPKDKELKEYYEKNLAQFKQPASFNIGYAVFPSIEKANEASELLSKGASLEKTAKGMKLEFKQTGFFNEGSPAPGLEWLAQNQQILSNLKQLKYSPPIEIGASYYILSIKDKKDASTPEYKAVAKKVKELFVNAEALKLAEQKINLCAEELKKRDFKQAAKKCGLKVKDTAPFKFGAQIPGIGSSDILWNTARSLKPEENSKVIRLGDGFYIVKAKAIPARDEKKYEKEKPQFSQKILEQKQEEKFNEFMGELLKKARAN